MGLLEKIDRKTLPLFYQRISVSTWKTRKLLRESNRPFVDPDLNESPARDQLDETANWVIMQSRANQTLIAGIAGLGGVLSIPPEVLHALASTIRLAQRLAIIYGFDPSTDRGQLVVWQVMAAGVEADLPSMGGMSMRLSELPAVFFKPMTPAETQKALTRHVVYGTASRVGFRLMRMIPLAPVGLSAAAANRRSAGIAERMMATLQRLCTAPLAETETIEEALEVEI